ADDHRNNGVAEFRGLRVELFAKFHDVHAVLTERGSDWGRWIRFARGNLQLHIRCYFFRHYAFSTCENSRSIGVERPKMLTKTLSRPFSGFTSSTVPAKFANGPSFTRTLSPFSNSMFTLGFNLPSLICCVMRS